MGETKQEGFRADSRAYRQLAHPVFMAVPPAKFLSRKSAKKQGGLSVAGPPTRPLRDPFPSPARPHSAPTNPTRIPAGSVRLKGTLRVWAGRGRGPECGGGEGLPVYRTQWRLRTETPRPQELEHLLQDPQGVHCPGPYLMAERRVRRRAEVPHLVHIPMASWAPSLPYLSSTPEITAQQSPQQDQKRPGEAGSGEAQGPQEAAISRVGVSCHLSPGWPCDTMVAKPLWVLVSLKTNAVTSVSPHLRKP